MGTASEFDCANGLLMPFQQPRLVKAGVVERLLIPTTIWQRPIYLQAFEESQIAIYRGDLGSTPLSGPDAAMLQPRYSSRDVTVRRQLSLCCYSP